MESRTGRRRAGAAIALTLGLMTSGCTGGTGAPQNAPTQAPEASGQAGDGEVDCAAVGGVFLAFAAASFSGMSTETTNAEAAAAYAAVADQFDAVQAPADASQWDTFGEVLDEYVAQWSALPADGEAISNVEAVEDAVDDFADARDFDNDDYDDVTAIVGATCAAELDQAGG
jgi:hypothetical protein